MSLFDFARNGSLGGTTRATAPASGERPAQPVSSDREAGLGGAQHNRHPASKIRPVSRGTASGVAPDSAQGQKWLEHLAAVLVFGITVAGFFKSWGALTDLACSSGAVPCQYAWLLPLITDASVVVAEIAIWVDRRRGLRSPSAWAFAAAYVALSIAGNGLDVAHRGWVAIGIAVLFPVTAFLAFPKVLNIVHGRRHASTSVNKSTVATAGSATTPEQPHSEALPALVKFSPLPVETAAASNGASVEESPGAPGPASPNLPLANGHTPLGPYNGGQKAKALAWLQEHPDRAQAAPSKTALIAECAAATGVSKGTAANALKEFRTPTNEGA